MAKISEKYEALYIINPQLTEEGTQALVEKFKAMVEAEGTLTEVNEWGKRRLAVDAISSRDMPLLQGTVVFTTILIILGNLLADVLYSVIDPRIRTDH